MTESTFVPWYVKPGAPLVWRGLPWQYQRNQFMLTHIGGGMLTDRFIFIGMPHTGGGSLHQWLWKWPGLKRLDNSAHRPFGYYASVCKAKHIKVPPAFVLARNPWEWNVTVWCWIRSIKRKYFCGSFNDFLEWQRYSRHWALPDLNISGISCVWEYLEADKATHFGTLETYKESITQILLKLIPDLITKKQILAEIERVGKFNYREPPGKIKPYQEYYSPAQRKLVAELEAPIIERFGYSFNDKGVDF